MLSKRLNSWAIVTFLLWNIPAFSESNDTKEAEISCKGGSIYDTSYDTLKIGENAKNKGKLKNAVHCFALACNEQGKLQGCVEEFQILNSKLKNLDKRNIDQVEELYLLEIEAGVSISSGLESLTQLISGSKTEKIVNEFYEMQKSGEKEAIENLLKKTKPFWTIEQQHSLKYLLENKAPVFPSSIV